MGKEDKQKPGPIQSGNQPEEIHSNCKQTEDTLRKNEARSRAIFENMSSGVAVYTAIDDGNDFVFSDFNSSAERIEKVRKEQIIGRRVTEVFPGVRKFGLLEVLQRVWRTGQPETHPISFYHDQRISGWRENYICKLPSGEIVTIYQDVTERKQTEKALKESEDKFRMLAESFPNLIFINQDGRIVYVNQRCVDVMGYSREEFYDASFDFRTLVAPEYHTVVNESLLKHQKGEELLPYEYDIITREGRRISAVYGSKIIRYKGQLSVLGTITDITERKQAENALKENEGLLNRIFDQSPIGTAIVSMQGFFIRVNDAFCRMLGYSEKEMKSLKFTDITHPDHLKEDRKQSKRVAKGEIEQYDTDKRYIRKDGSIIWGHVSLRVIRDHENKPLYLLPMIIDINEQKEAEKQIKEQSKALEQKNIALAELLEHVTIEKEGLTKKIASNLEKMVVPKLYRLKDKLSIPQKRLFASVEKSIKDISTGYGMKITNKTIALSRREMEICSMIKEGYKNKEIAQELYLSARTIETMRKNIRKKLKIRNKSVNLESYLKSL